MLMTGDGSIHKMLVSRSGSPFDTSCALEGSPNGLRYGDWYARPLAIHFRALEKQSLGCNLADLKFVAKDRSVNGVACDEYNWKFGGNRSQTFWFDPAREFVLVRMRMEGGSVLLTECQIDVEYQIRDNFGLVPVKWIVTQYGPKEKVRSISVVELASLSNTIDLPNQTFDLAFPKHSIVRDGRFANTKYRVNDRGQLIELDVLGQPVGSSMFPVIVRIWFLRFRLWILVGALIGIAALLAYLGRRWLRWRASLRRPVPTSELPFV